jgi:hypothetical protein
MATLLEAADMIDRSKRFRLGVARCALAFLLMFGVAPSADAAFTVSINGTTITDNGAGDTDSTAGFITYQNTIDGYQLRLSSSTDASRPTADLTTSQLRIVNTASTGATSGPLLVTLSETFSVPPGFRGEQALLNTLTRNIVAGLGTSGVVSSTTGAASESGGGSGTSAPTTLTNSVDSGVSDGSFIRTSDGYLLTQTIDISGLLGGDGVTITASSFSFANGGNLTVVPAPPAFALVAGGVLTLSLYRRLRPGRERRAG